MPKQNHCYGHTPQIQKGAKTSNSGVERNVIRYTVSLVVQMIAVCTAVSLVVQMIAVCTAVSLVVQM